jgi:hypothetical protein
MESGKLVWFYRGVKKVGEIMVVGKACFLIPVLSG